MLGRALAEPVAPGKPEKLNREVISDLFLSADISHKTDARTRRPQRSDRASDRREVSADPGHVIPVQPFLVAHPVIRADAATLPRGVMSPATQLAAKDQGENHPIPFRVCKK